MQSDHTYNELKHLTCLTCILEVNSLYTHYAVPSVHMYMASFNIGNTEKSLLMVVLTKKSTIFGSHSTLYSRTYCDMILLLLSLLRT